MPINSKIIAVKRQPNCRIPAIVLPISRVVRSGPRPVRAHEIPTRSRAPGEPSTRARTRRRPAGGGTNDDDERHHAPSAVRTFEGIGDRGSRMYGGGAPPTKVPSLPLRDMSLAMPSTKSHEATHSWGGSDETRAAVTCTGVMTASETFMVRMSHLSMLSRVRVLPRQLVPIRNSGFSKGTLKGPKPDAEPMLFSSTCQVRFSVRHDRVRRVFRLVITYSIWGCGWLISP